MPVGVEGLDEVAVAGVLGGLLNVRVGAGKVGLKYVLVATGRGQDDDGDRPQDGVRLDVSQDLAAVDAREVEVEEDKVGRVDVKRLRGGKFFI